jgi:hypothetical protein
MCVKTPFGLSLSKGEARTQAVPDFRSDPEGKRNETSGSSKPSDPRPLLERHDEALAEDFAY